MDLRPFALERYFARHEFSARHLLGSSDPESMTVGDLLALSPGGRERLERLWLGYTETAGSPALREAIARTYEGISPAQVLAFSGAEEPLFAFMSTVMQPGDHVVVHAPCYQSHAEVARARGAEVTAWRGDAARGFALDVDELPRLLRPHTRAVLVSVPHNPTGFLFGQADWRRLVERVRQSGAWLVSDEVYRGLEHAPGARLPSACELSDRAVSIDAVSKSMGLPGLRLGWLATRDRALYAQLAAFKDYTTICNAAPSELLAEVALQHADALQARCRALLARNLQALTAFMARHADTFSWQPPQAGTTTYPGLRRGGAEALCDRLLQQHGLLLVPSTLFHDGDAHVRVGYGRAHFTESLSVLDAALARG
jgi:aspartate/methionine/tyrosine aminotransferase